MAATVVSAVSALTAIYFIGSAIRTQRYLLNDGSQDAANDVANRAAMRRLMRRVRASGCLMLAVTLAFAIGVNFITHPTGFAVVFCIM